MPINQNWPFPGDIQISRKFQDPKIKTYSQKCGLKMHVNIVHRLDEAKPFTCDLCGKGYFHKTGLKARLCLVGWAFYNRLGSTREAGKYILSVLTTVYSWQ